MSTTGSDPSRLASLLGVAAELEHGLCLQYLFTAFSLKVELSEGGLTFSELTSVRKWRANILFVASQEMLHLVQVANLCSAVGLTVPLRRPNFPQRPGYYPTGLPWGLWPFSERVMELYAAYERPSGPLSGRAAATALLARTPSHFDDLLVDAATEKDPFGHLPERFDRPTATRQETIAELYAAIDEQLDEPGIVVGDPTRQLDGRCVDFPQLIAVTDRERAHQAIRLIVEQGEGAPGDRPDSHFGIFLRILEECRGLAARRGEFDPVRDVQANPLSRLHVDNTFPGWRLIEDPYTRVVNDLSNGVYRAVLHLIEHVAASPDGEPAASSAIRVMTAAVAPLGELLTRLPMGRDGSSGDDRRASRAGPGFEVDDRDPAPAAGAASLRLLGRELEAAASAAHRLADSSPAGARAERTLSSVASTLEEIGSSLAQSAPASMPDTT